jgi:hypothetical protein
MMIQIVNLVDYNLQSYIADLQQKARERETTVFSCIFSEDGEYLICGTNFGMINIWRIDPFLVNSN